MIAQGSHYNLKRQYTIYWGLVDVRVLPTAPNAKEGLDSAVIHTIMPLPVGPPHARLYPHAHQCAVNLLKAELPALGYELKYLDEFKYYEDMQWQTDEDTQLYSTLSAKARETKKLQLGRIHFYSSSNAGEDEDEG
jgi:hypothetical protein